MFGRHKKCEYFCKLIKSIYKYEKDTTNIVIGNSLVVILSK